LEAGNGLARIEEQKQSMLEVRRSAMRPMDMICDICGAARNSVIHESNGRLVCDAHKEYYVEISKHWRTLLTGSSITFVPLKT